MIDNIACGECHELITPYSEITLDHGSVKQYKCVCGEFYTITVSYASEVGKENRKAQSCDTECGDHNPYKRFEDREEHNEVVALIIKLVGKGLDGYDAETILYINHLIGELQR